MRIFDFLYANDLFVSINEHYYGNDLDIKNFYVIEYTKFDIPSRNLFL